MKKYVSPIIRFNQVSHSHEIIATSLLIWDEEANPEDPILAPKRDKDWEDWE